jgi:hypothetical protein
MTPADPLDTSAVRSTPRPSAPDGPQPGRRLDTSRLVVLAFALLFVLGALGFLASVLNANERTASPSPAATGSTPGAAAAIDMGVAADTALQQASPSSGQSVDPTPSLAADPSLASTDCLRSPALLAASVTPDTSPSASGSAIVPELASLEPAASAPVDPGASPDVAVPIGPSPSCDPVVSTTARRMPFVPVIRYWETRESISTADLKQALRGNSPDWPRVMISHGDRAALETALDITIDSSVREATPGAIIAAVKKGNTLGILRATDVQPSVRALAIDGRDLFGNDRVQKVSRWPLVALVDTTAKGAWDQGAAWTMVAGGDSFTDRGLYERVVRRKKGVDYPFAGGTARVTGHHICTACPRANGNSIPSYTLSGPKGIVRALVKDADLALANHEQPTPTNWSFHLQGTTFSGKPDLTQIFVNGGIDWMSLANNHIRDYGATGVMNTLKTLDTYGIKHAGAGANLKQAAKPSYLKVKGQTIAIVSCVTIAVGYVQATRNSPGALPCKSKEAFAAIRAARKRADILIVFPHWGIEFSRSRAAYQEQLAKRWADMGVDLVLGAHSHIPGGIGDIDGTPVFYSLGNFIFDQNWSTNTTEGVLLEMTWQGSKLVQVRLHPFLTVDQAQPNLLNPRTDDGKALMKAIRNASKGINDW